MPNLYVIEANCANIYSFTSYSVVDSLGIQRADGGVGGGGGGGGGWGVPLSTELGRMKPFVVAATILPVSHACVYTQTAFASNMHSHRICQRSSDAATGCTRQRICSLQVAVTERTIIRPAV